MESAVMASRMVILACIGFFLAFPPRSYADNRTIGVSWADLGSETWKADEFAMQAAIEAGGDRYVARDAKGSVERQLSDIKALSEEADALIINPVDPAAIVPALKELHARGLPVLSYDAVIPDPAVIQVIFDYVRLGQMQAKFVLDNVPGGKVVILGGPKADPEAKLINYGQIEELEGPIARGDITVIGDISTSDWSTDTAQREMEQFLTVSGSNPDAVLASTDTIAVGANQALAKEGFSSRVKMTGSGADIEALKRIIAGEQSTTAFKDHRELAIAAARAAIELAAGTTPQSVKEVSKAYETLFGDALQGILIEPVMITAENAATVIDAGYVDKATICDESANTAIAACRSNASGLPVVDVCFATDRNSEQGDGRVHFLKDRSDVVSLGFAQVSVPEDVHEFGRRERPEKQRFLWIFTYDEKEDPDKHFVIQSIEVLDENAFRSKAESVLQRSNFYENEVLLFIHGFSVPFDDAIYTAAQVAWDINFDGLPCVYSWPSMGEISLTGYTYDTNSAQQSRSRLAAFMESLAGLSGSPKISIVAHSMGNLALIEALRELPERSDADRKLFDEIILAAPDLDRDNFRSLAGKFTEFAAGVTLYASANDRALRASMELAGSIPRAGDVPAGGPLVLSGIDSIDASAVSRYAFGLNHSYFAYDRSVVSDIGKILLNHQRPPITRNATLRQMVKSNGDTYWKFPQ